VVGLPYQLIGKTRVSAPERTTTLEIYHQASSWGRLICACPAKAQFTTLIRHRPERHSAGLELTHERAQATRVGHRCSYQLKVLNQTVCIGANIPSRRSAVSLGVLRLAKRLYSSGHWSMAARTRAGAQGL
jgi:hypothetical protein